MTTAFPLDPWLRMHPDTAEIVDPTDRRRLEPREAGGGL